jgi:hypothetical protein
MSLGHARALVHVATGNIVYKAAPPELRRMSFSADGAACVIFVLAQTAQSLTSVH